jgi:hypothetical protein
VCGISGLIHKRPARRAAEERYGLRRTAPGDRTAAWRPSRAEQEKAQRHGRQEAPRVTLKRAVSTAVAGAASEQEFFARLADSRVLVRKLNARNPGEVTGYAVAPPWDTTATSAPVWFGGGKLAADLTLPRLHRRWESADQTFTRHERAELWETAARTAGDASTRIRLLAATRPAQAADAAWAASDTLHAVAAVLESRMLRRAADSYDRAARAQYGRIPTPTPTGNSLRRSARLLSRATVVGDDRTLAMVTLVARLAALAEAVVELRLVQRHGAQAAAARQAAEQLRAARDQLRTSRGLRRTAAQLASVDVPARRVQPSVPRRDRPTHPHTRSPRKPRGPTR